MRKLIILVSLVAVLETGCGEKEVAPNATSGSGTAVVKQTAQQSDQPKTDGAASIGSQISDVMNQIGETSSDAATGVSEMASTLMDGVANTSTEAAQETADWVNSLYEKARQTGETTATSAKDWVVDDFQRGGSWQYRVVETTGDSAAQQTQLNKLGQERWECFEVSTGAGDSQVFYLRRRSQSVIRSLPARDLLRLLPLLGSGGGE
ncbi:MAG: hypothetical protein AB8G99_07945 [Planctomycetaceae bacterium]